MSDFVSRWDELSAPQDGDSDRELELKELFRDALAPIPRRKPDASLASAERSAEGASTASEGGKS